MTAIRENVSLPRLTCLAAAGACSCALGVIFQPAWMAGLALGLAWAGLGFWRFRWAGLVPAIPVLAVLPFGGGWYGLSAWSLVALFAAVSANFLPGRGLDQGRIRQLRNELRDAEHERELLHRHIQRYPVLLEACLELSAARNLEQLAQALCARVRALIPNLREVAVFLGAGEDQVCRASSDVEGNPCPRPAGSDERYVASEARSLTQRDGDAMRVLVPLRGDRRRQGETDSLRGVLEVVFATNDASNRLNLDLLDALSRLGGLGLASVDLLTQARALAMHDELTGLYGQHEFLRRLDEAAAAARRLGQPLGLMMCDMDHLKRYNDRHGHAAGDQALRAVATAMRLALPARSLLCRYGGEEFAAAIVGASADNVRATAEIVRQSIAQTKVGDGDLARRVTASIGITMLGGEESSREALSRADAACYRAKANGRDRVEVAA